MTIAFIDTETTGLAETTEVWEIGMVIRDHAKPAYDGEWLWQVRPRNMSFAEPMGLSIGKFYERFALVSTQQAQVMKSPIHGQAGDTTAEQTAFWISLLTAGAQWVGAVPDFDVRQLSPFVEDNGWKLAHHYHLIDIEPLAAGYVRGWNDAVATGNTGDLAPIKFDAAPPWKSRELMAAIGVVGDPKVEHTALGDALWAAEVYDRVYGTS